jgi:hydrogenase expression/formation protein HypE
VSGAEPVALLLTLVLEAGLPTEALDAELRAIASAARRAGVTVVGGDTKVVEHGNADGMYVTTAGIGRVDPRAALSTAAVRPGDRILLSGPIGDHGITILLARGEVDLEADLRSDTRSVYPMVQALIASVGSAVRWMRDPTRGGVASALNELASDTRLGVVLAEETIPVRDEVRGACELLGLEPLHIANEGQFLAVVAPDRADEALQAVRSAPGGEGARLIGEVRSEPARTVLAASAYGSARVVDMLVGDPLPRIC